MTQFNKDSIAIPFIALLFVLSPFLGGVCALLAILLFKFRDNEYNAIYFIIALFWGFLAFTQKSTAAIMDTDIIRYYKPMEEYLSYGIETAFLLNFQELLNFTFTFINVFATTLTKNVQYIGLFWTTFSYFIYFISVHKLLKFKDLLNKRNIFTMLVVSMFCFMLFVQITETIKNAAAFALFFYVLTRIIVGEQDKKNLLYLFLAAGIHMSIVMLFPLLFYRKFKTSVLFIIAIISLPILASFNIMEIISLIVPDNGFYALLLQKAENYSVNLQSSSIRYIGILSLSVLGATYVWQVKNKTDYLCNIIFLYFTIASLNFVNLSGYVRFANFSHYIYALLFVSLLDIERLPKISKLSRLRPIVLSSVVFIMFFVTILMTDSRLNGSYSSSFMNNSIVNIIASTSWDYLTFKYK